MNWKVKDGYEKLSEEEKENEIILSHLIVTQWEDQSHGENDTCGNSLGASPMDEIVDSQ